MTSLPRHSLSHPAFRFEIRPCHPTCTEEVYRALEESRETVSPWMAWFHADYGLRDAEGWVAHSMEAWDGGLEYGFIIYDRMDDALVGTCGLNEINRRDLVCNLGYWVRKSKARLGAATQAVSLIRDFGFERVGLNRLEMVIAEGNQASQGVAEKVGAVYEGLQRSRIRVRDRVHNAHMYALVASRPNGPHCAISENR